MFFKRKKKESEPKCRHIWHDIGSYKEKYESYNGFDLDFHSVEYHVIYCEMCDQRKKFANIAEKEIELKISEINKKVGDQKYRNQKQLDS